MIKHSHNPHRPTKMRVVFTLLRPYSNLCPVLNQQELHYLNLEEKFGPFSHLTIKCKQKQSVANVGMRPVEKVCVQITVMDF